MSSLVLWPLVYLNSNGFLYVSTVMALVKRFQQWHLGHIVHTNTQFVREATRSTLSLLEGSSTCDERALGMGTVKEGMSIRKCQQVLAMASQAFTNKCQQETMHKHTQIISKGMLVMVVLMSFSWRGTHSRGVHTKHRQWQMSSFQKGTQSIGKMASTSFSWKGTQSASNGI